MITENITGLHDLLKIALMNTDVLWGWEQRTQLSSANVTRTTTSCLTLEWCTSCVSLSERFTLKFGSPSSLCSALPEIQCKTLFSHWHKHKRSSTSIRAQKPANWLIEQTKPCVTTQEDSEELQLNTRLHVWLKHGFLQFLVGFFRKRAFPKHRGF